MPGNEYSIGCRLDKLLMCYKNINMNHQSSLFSKLVSKDSMNRRIVWSSEFPSMKQTFSHSRMVFNAGGNALLLGPVVTYCYQFLVLTNVPKENKTLYYRPDAKRGKGQYLIEGVIN